MSVKNSDNTSLHGYTEQKEFLMCLVSAVLGVVMVVDSMLRCWTGSNADRSTDQNSFAEAHSAVTDGQVPHAAHVGLPGGDALWEEQI